MTSETTFQFVAIALILVTMSISIYYRSRAARSGEKISPLEEGPLILNLRRIFGLALWLSIFAYLINPRWMAWSSLPLPAACLACRQAGEGLRWLGAGIMALCVPMVYWLFSSLGKNVTSTVAIRKEHTLVTHGPYRWVRHPLYSVGFAAFIGFSLLAANWFIFATLLLAFGVLMLRTPIEERHLIERFGDEYLEYMQRTGRYLPRLKGISI
jgi:protein-S-isoprenylcysteine O-methyltransferase Ste14